MTRMDAGAAVVAASFALDDEAIAAEQVRAGAPRAGYVDLDETDSRTIGLWEHTPGVSTDVESDEVFVVVAGAATLEFVDPELPAIELRPGVIVRLTAGMRTVWTVHDTLRKVYVI
ncbi:cupin domain-containing protein [Microbacterium luticocti]|uniref:cupin domain-containing protein n=1 Tax=Microbacterium luticocti TaxID=451764 RepID=UPI00049154C1|nr:cupin domain-containing protein [Microbacterium luticocti]